MVIHVSYSHHMQCYADDTYCRSFEVGTRRRHVVPAKTRTTSLQKSKTREFSFCTGSLQDFVVQRFCKPGGFRLRHEVRLLC